MHSIIMRNHSQHQFLGHNLGHSYHFQLLHQLHWDYPQPLPYRPHLHQLRRLQLGHLHLHLHLLLVLLTLLHLLHQSYRSIEQQSHHQRNQLEFGNLKFLLWLHFHKNHFLRWIKVLMYLLGSSKCNNRHHQSKERRNSSNFSYFKL